MEIKIGYHPGEYNAPPQVDVTAKADNISFTVVIFPCVNHVKSSGWFVGADEAFVHKTLASAIADAKHRAEIAVKRLVDARAWIAAYERGESEDEWAHPMSKWQSE